MPSKVNSDALARAARVYHSNADAARAVGCHPLSFARLCREHGIETPGARRRRQWREAQAVPESHHAELAV